MTSAHEPAQALGRFQPAAKGLPELEAREDCAARQETASPESIDICPTENDGTRRHKSPRIGHLSSQSRQADFGAPSVLLPGAGGPVAAE